MNTKFKLITASIITLVSLRVSAVDLNTASKAEIIRATEDLNRITETTTDCYSMLVLASYQYDIIKIAGVNALLISDADDLYKLAQGPYSAQKNNKFARMIFFRTEVIRLMEKGLSKKAIQMELTDLCFLKKVSADPLNSFK